jgi:DNA-binding PadR family transcriptional regulator
VPRRPNELSRIEVLVLSSLARRPMHVYELKLELRYKHVRWWAKAEHGLLYAAVARLAKRKDIKLEKPPPGQKGKAAGRQVYGLTLQGKERIDDALQRLAQSADSTYFDTDLFLSGCTLLSQGDVVELLQKRGKALRGQEGEARQISAASGPHAPTVGRLIMQHRVEHLGREAAFCEHAAAKLQSEERWGPFLGDRSVIDFIRERNAPVEP